MNIHNFINDWLIASNNFDTEKYLEFYESEAILDDPSVGRKFVGHKGIRDYFESYFIGYNTNTKLVNLNIKDAESVHLEVEFTGDFSEGKLGGIFDLKFKDEKITFAKADLIH
ncbi:ketosteroid isomerase-like protein [Flavobacterium nitrogenifigens]|uniref:Ketosteroid isomerase-like protein n=2 Tax=Flavobacterium TaxID=237 RepID=A0A7W7J1M9_9FLAO|nr:MULTISPECIES: nuclear transport factor 2 family protein [Flavobacterium]MBB4804606.1 ketosteroid isomerase-like protein [Flavobacterium nitrogenifigens]MBB6389565.1 ketosteroid isomerase-like protein [Flavobacterium notoginsengisoli]